VADGPRTAFAEALATQETLRQLIGDALPKKAWNASAEADITDLVAQH